MSTTNDLINSIEQVKYNPAAIQRVVLSTLENTTNGDIRVVDPTNPVVFTLESGIACAVVAINEAEALSRRQYPSLAQTEDELYYHMSDDDYLGRFSYPSKVSNLNFLIPLDDIRRNAKEIPGTNIRKITIPKHTEVTVSDIAFTFQYPIDIKILPNDGISIVYNEDYPSPIQTLSTNVVDWMLTRIGQDQYIIIKFDLLQMKIKSYSINVNASNGFKKSYTFDDSFFFCRAFIKDTLNQWTEIRTTHTDQVYDPNIATVALSVTTGTLTVTIPQIYLNNGRINDNLRIDIYSTKGPLDMLLVGQDTSKYDVSFNDYDAVSDSIYSAPLGVVGVNVFCEDGVSGGEAALSFDSLREKVISNSLGTLNIPITPPQLSTTLERNGYELVMDKDSITSRVYLASRMLPTPSNEIVSVANYSTVTPANASIRMFQSSVESLMGLSYTYWNSSSRLVLKPNALFLDNNGVLSNLSDASINNLNTLTKEQLVDEINNKQYLYSPFHYIMDIGGSTYSLRPYSLNTPRPVNKFYVDQSDTAGIDVAIGDYSIEYKANGTGYRILVSTKSSQAFKDLDHANGQVALQMSYIPPGFVERAVMTGVDITPVDFPERVYQFDITTDFDITALHRVLFKSFHMLDTGAKTLECNLDTTFDFIFVVKDYNPQGLLLSNIDTYIQPFELGSYTNYVGVSHETIRFVFGDYLERLWKRARSVIGPENYLKYTTNIYAYYENDVYERDSAGNVIIDYVDNEIVVNKIHSQGDPVLDGSGNPVIKHHIGDAILDANGAPQLVGGSSNRGMLRQSDLFLIDAVYYFATAEATTEYRDSIPKIVRDWVVEDIATISKGLLERTELYFYPKSTTGPIPVKINEEDTVLIEAAQSLRVIFTVNSEVYSNIKLRSAMESSTISLINQHLDKEIISLSQMITSIQTFLNTNIISVEILGLADNLKTFTLVDRSAKPSIGKKAILLADQSIVVEDSITFEFIRQ